MPPRSPVPSVRAHHSEAAHTPGGEIVRHLVFGANDGLVAAFAVVSGLHGVASSGTVVFAGGLAELLGGTIAMGLGAWLATTSAREFFQAEESREHDEIDRFPDEERAEVRRAFAAEGFSGEVLDRIVAHVTADRARWVKTMMDRELGLAPIAPGAARQAALATGLAYGLAAAVPTVPYAFLSLGAAFPVSVALTLITLFAVGAAKSRVSVRAWWRSGLESLLVGVLAAGATWIAGSLVGRMGG
jgi:VIT1/CCC1 family predicted Fe2+/Mn2+ transporter